MQRASLGLLVIALSGCGAEPTDLAVDIAAVTDDPTVRFNADWSLEVQGTLQEGRRLSIVYASERASCQASNGGRPAWTVTAHYRWNGGDVESTYAAGHNPDPSAPAAGIDLNNSGNLEIWFENTSISGCQSWDSNYGANYRFDVKPATRPVAAGWVGGASFAFERATCDGRVCPGAWHSLESAFNYETWARQRAALRVVGFEVWAPGITDFDNADLWRQLDVQVRYRFVGDTAFTSSYVSFDQRWGNNAHYTFDLRSIDPFEWPRGASIRTAADCPSFTLHADPSGQYAVADLELYFVINGVELRTASGAPFRGAYQDYLGNYGVCF